MQALVLLQQKCPCVCSSVTLWCRIKTTKATAIFSPTESPNTLVFADTKFEIRNGSLQTRALNETGNGMHDWCPGVPQRASALFHASLFITHALLQPSLPLLTVPNLTTDFSERSFSYSAPVIWNILPSNILLCNSDSVFRKHLKTFMFTAA